MKYKLIMLDNPIIVSDEEHKIGDKIIHKTTFDLSGSPDSIGSTNEHWWKIIAGLPELPSIDFSALSEEECKKIGWVDVGIITQQHFKDYWKKENSTEMKGDEISAEMMAGMLCETSAFIAGFKAAQSISEKKFSEEDVIDLLNHLYEEPYYTNWSQGKIDPKDIVSHFIQVLYQQKVFDVEIEMEEYGTIMKDFKDVNFRPKITKIL